MLSEDQILDEEHDGYHRSITGEEAERRLKAHGNHCYLTRYSEKNKCYMLSVYQKSPTPITKHFRISFKGSGDSKTIKIEGKTREFKGIRDLLREYESNPIDPAFMSIGRALTERECTTKTKHCTIL